jgi:hypothetical protein
MSKVLDVKVSWTRSPSADIASRKVAVTTNGTTTTYDVGPEVSEMVLEVKASATVQVQTIVYDSEGNQAASEIATFTAGDSRSPLPDTDFQFTPIGVRDVVDASVA